MDTQAVAVDSTGRSCSRGFLASTLVLAAAGAAISILASSYTRPVSLLLDENYYYPLAEGILKGSYQDGYIIRPPLYPLFLAGIFKVFGVGFSPALVISSLVRGGLVAGIALMGRRYVSALAGLLAACLVALYPMLVFTYTRFVSEVLYVPLFVASFWFLDRAARTERVRDFLGAGAAAGIATLARSTSLFFTLAAAVWIVARKSRAGRFSRRNLASGAVLVGAMLAAISPWTVRNAVVHRALVLVDNSSAYNLWLMTSGKQVRDATEEWTSWGSQAERQKQGYARWLEYLRQDPAFHLKRMAIVIPKLFDPRGQPDVYSLSTIFKWGSARESPALRRTVKILAPVVFWVITAGGILGLALLERDRSRRNLVILTVACFILIHAATLARPRFLLPMNAVLAIWAGALIAAGLSGLGLTRRNRP